MTEQHTAQDPIKCRLAVIGAGCAGMAAACAAYDSGVTDVVIFEINSRPGGVLGQCIHAGFGLSSLGTELTGPEFSAHFEAEIQKRNIPILYESPVTGLGPDRTMTVISKDRGFLTLKPEAVISAQGCRERPAGAIGLSGTRPAGVLTAGTAQRYLNIEGYCVGKKAVILGSGDIGLIMARRLTLEGAKVLCVCEMMPYSNGLNRNIVQCLNDYDIPLRLSTTVTALEGNDRLTGVRIAPVDPVTLQPDLSKEERLDCDTLLLSVGLIPETGLLADAGVALGGNRGIAVDNRYMTSIPGVFAAGNVVQVHDLADFAAAEGTNAGKEAAAWILGKSPASAAEVSLNPGSGVSYVVPEKALCEGRDITLSLRVRNVFRGAALVVKEGDRVLCSRKRPIMVPGQMEKITLPADLLHDGASLTVSAEM